MKTTLYTILLTTLLVYSSIINAIEPQKKDKQQSIEMLYANVEGQGTEINLKFSNGQAHNHPTFAVWVEDLEGEFIQTLFVTNSLATGVYAHGTKADGLWSRESGPARRPATLPYFLHKRGVKAYDNTYLPTPDNPIVDSYTGATPKVDFTLGTKSDEPLTGKIRLMVEVNQTWDWNEYWHNTKYPDDVDYATSCQPSLVYQVIIDLSNLMESYVLNPVGHGHYSGKDGKLYTDISTLTTAKEIFSKIEVNLIKQ